VPVTIAAASGRLIAFRDLHSERRIFPELEWRVANPQHKRRTNRPTALPFIQMSLLTINLLTFLRGSTRPGLYGGITRVVSLP
jgi:hypothetical protein